MVETFSLRDFLHSGCHQSVHGAEGIVVSLTMPLESVALVSVFASWRMVLFVGRVLQGSLVRAGR